MIIFILQPCASASGICFSMHNFPGETLVTWKCCPEASLLVKLSISQLGFLALLEATSKVQSTDQPPQVETHSGACNTQH